MGKKMSEQKNAFKNLINRFSAAFDKCVRDKAFAENSEIVEYVGKKTKGRLDAPDVFFSTVLEPVMIIAGERIAETYKKNNEKIKKIFIYFDFFEKHIEHLIIKTEGIACSADKVNWLICRYIDCCVTGKLPEMEKAISEYWKPGFGTGRAWMDYIDSLVELREGKYDVYMLCLHSLLLAKKERQEEENQC